MKELKELAAKVKESLNLNYDAESVKFLEGFIERNKLEIPKEDWDGLINSCSAFLGQCIIENYGGYWEKKPDGAILIVFNDRNEVNPFAKTRKQFENGLEDSVYGMFSMIPLVFKDYVKFKKKKWWQF